MAIHTFDVVVFIPTVKSKDVGDPAYFFNFDTPLNPLRLVRDPSDSVEVKLSLKSAPCGITMLTARVAAISYLFKYLDLC